MMPQMKLVNLVDTITKCIENNDCKWHHMKKEVDEFARFVHVLHPSIAQCTLPLLVTPFLALHSKQAKFQLFSEENKIFLIAVLQDILSKTKISNENGFDLHFDFLLVQLVGSRPAAINAGQKSSEEYKLAVCNCIEHLFASISWDLYLDIYTEKNLLKLRLLLHTCLDILKNEKNRSLRLSALECIVKAAKVDDQSDMEDLVLLAQIADMFATSLPGIAACLIVIAVDDVKCGYKIVAACVKAWARLVCLVLRNYNSNPDPLQLENVFTSEYQMQGKSERVNDEKLSLCAKLLLQLTGYDHSIVRKQLIESSELLTRTCFKTLPATIPKIIEILLVLADNGEDEESSKIANKVLINVVHQLADDVPETKAIVANLQQNFHQHVTKLPRIFNSLNDAEQLTAITLLTGYLKLFKLCDRLKNILCDETHLSRLIGSLLYVARMEKGNLTLLEEHTLHEWTGMPDYHTPWKVMKFNNIQIQNKLENACHLLAQPVITEILLDSLLDIFHNDLDQKAEATLLINEIVSAQAEENGKFIIDTYTSEDTWNLALAVVDKTPLKDVQTNVLQLCLQLEGIGKIALALGTGFHRYLLKVLYIILEKAGNNHALLRAAGLACMTNISVACEYTSVTDLINRNADYFGFNVTNNLRRRSENERVLNVLAVVMKHSSMDVLPAISDIIEGVLLQSCDRFQEHNAESYLRVFAVFMKSMHHWLDIQITIEPIKTKREQEEKLEAMRRLQWEELSKPIDMSDAIMEKSAEELFEEDMLARQKEESAEENEGTTAMEEIKKPLPPKHIQLVVQMLERSLHFLPSKCVEGKILVLEILKLGVEVLKDYEDELLPIVHKIWSPLVNRFSEISTPLVINLAFNLLVTLGRLSKDFIRMRTIKEVLPTINSVLVKQANESYLKDRGSAYRYTQAYKMQLSIVSNIGRLVYDLELEDKTDIILPGVEVYLSSKQPAPLQEAALKFYRMLVHHDPISGEKIINALHDKYQHREDWNRNLNVLLSITQVDNS